jgi:hemin uptake protein HemP
VIVVANHSCLQCITVNTKLTSPPDPTSASALADGCEAPGAGVAPPAAAPRLQTLAAPAIASPRFKAQGQAQAPRRLASRDLLGTAQEVQIDHDGAIYRLRCTAQGKLILTK